MATIAARATRTKFDSTRGGVAARARRGDRLLGAREAGVVLVDVELAVEPEILRVRAQEPLHIRVAGEDLEALGLERLKVLSPDLRALFDAGEVQALTEPRLAQAVADLEHGPRL